MLKNKVSIGCAGHDLSHVPAFADIESFVEQMKVAIGKGMKR